MVLRPGAAQKAMYFLLSPQRLNTDWAHHTNLRSTQQLIPNSTILISTIPLYTHMSPSTSSFCCCRRRTSCTYENHQVLKEETTLSMLGRPSARDHPSAKDGPRKLQSCETGSGISVTSSAFPLLEGCLAESEDVYSSDTGRIVSGDTEGGNNSTVTSCASCELYALCSVLQQK